MMLAMADHEKQQEKIAQDMIELSRSLKQQSLAARDIIKSDTQVMGGRQRLRMPLLFYFYYLKGPGEDISFS